MGCMGCGSKKPAAKKAAPAKKTSGGSFRPSGANPFGTPKIKMNFGSRKT